MDRRNFLKILGAGAATVAALPFPITVEWLESIEPMGIAEVRDRFLGFQLSKGDYLSSIIDSFVVSRPTFGKCEEEMMTHQLLCYYPKDCDSFNTMFFRGARMTYADNLANNQIRVTHWRTV